MVAGYHEQSERERERERENKRKRAMREEVQRTLRSTNETGLFRCSSDTKPGQICDCDVE